MTDAMPRFTLLTADRLLDGTGRPALEPGAQHAVGSQPLPPRKERGSTLTYERTVTAQVSKRDLLRHVASTKPVVSETLIPRS